MRMRRWSGIRCVTAGVLVAVGVGIGVECDTGPPEVVGSHVLLAVGRRPNTHDLGLDEAGIDTDERGFIVVDDELRTSVPHVWATGDANGREGYLVGYREDNAGVGAQETESTGVYGRLPREYGLRHARATPVPMRRRRK